MLNPNYNVVFNPQYKCLWNPNPIPPFGIGLEPLMTNHNVDLDIIAQNSAMDN